MSETYLRHRVYPRLYRDSVNLMALAAALEKEPGVRRVGAVMGTPANQDVLARSGMLPENWQVEPDDLCLVVRATSSASAEDALEVGEEILTAAPSSSDTQSLAFDPRSVREALKEGEASLVAISVPGEFAGSVAENALQQDCHVFCFSDNVPLSQENRLKTLAAERNLLMMGPDCGTALIDGTPLGFVNDLPAGPVGMIAASGTGAQEVSTLLARAGIGTSQIIGVGGHDLAGQIDHPATFVALDKLREDPKTEAVVIVSKPPAKEVTAKLLDQLKSLGKPAFACLLGEADQPGEVPVDGTLEGAAKTIAKHFGKELPAGAPAITESTAGRKLVGWYTGGTLAGEAEVLCERAGVEAEILDLGDDEYTQGRPHPMISPDLRTSMIEGAAADEVILLLDVVLGFGATDDPARPVAGAVSKLREAGKAPLVFASLTGTETDKQDFAAQKKILEDAGVYVFPSNAQAVRAATELVERATK